MENIFALIGSMFIFFVIGGLVLYVLSSLGLMKIAQSKGIENSWLAWIPFANLYIMGKIVGPFKLIIDISKPEVVLPILVLCSVIPLIGFLCSIAGMILYYGVLYNIYSQYKQKSAQTMLILSILLFFMSPIYLFNIGQEVSGN